MYNRQYDFPATKEDIKDCNNIEILKEWRKSFSLQLDQIEDDFGGFENVPAKMQKFVDANMKNLNKIEGKINAMQKPLNPDSAMRKFLTTMKEMFPNEYMMLSAKTMDSLGRAGEDFDKAIAQRPRQESRTRKPFFSSRL